jgi:hypothetical protein
VIRIFIAFVFWICISITASAQLANLGSWNIFNFKYNQSSKISFFGEAQLRSLQFYSNYHYYEFKGGFNFKPGNTYQLSLGLGSYQTYREGGNFVKPKNNDEVRLWPQLVLFQSLLGLKIEQRYRMEMRWTSTGYRNRFRYRVGASYPFRIRNNKSKDFQASFSNELFFTNNEPYFERNRFQMGLSYKVTKATTLQIGYLHQFDYRINDEIGRDFFVLGYFIEIFKKGAKRSSSESVFKEN